MGAKAIKKVMVPEENESVPGHEIQEVQVPEEKVADGYYYQQLSADEKEIYKEFYQGMESGKSSFLIHSGDEELIKKLNKFVLYDRAEMFWCDGNLNYTRYDNYSIITPVYTYTGAEREEKQAAVDAAVTQCLQGIDGSAPQYDKIKYVFEYIVNTVDYNLDAPDNQNICSALVNKESICAGYSRAAQLLLQKMGVECIYVTGSITDKGNHAWNIVKCDGKYYQMDVTFGDPVFLSEESMEEMPAQSINYEYLCCDDEEIQKNHEMDPEVSFPACTSDDLNYYKLNGMYYDTFDPEGLLQAMNQTIYDNKPSFTCKFADEALYAEAKDSLENNLIPRAIQNLVDYYGNQSRSYVYIDDPDAYKIVIFWDYD